jgi:hypothetical protein
VIYLLIDFCDASSFLTWISQSAHLHLVRLRASNLDSFFLCQRFFCARHAVDSVRSSASEAMARFLSFAASSRFLSADSVFDYGFPTACFLHSVISRPSALVFGERASIHPVFPNHSWASVFPAADSIFAPRSAAHQISAQMLSGRVLRASSMLFGLEFSSSGSASFLHSSVQPAKSCFCRCFCYSFPPVRICLLLDIFPLQ